MAPKITKDKKIAALVEQMRKDAAKDKMMNPASWSDVGKWAAMHELSYKDVVDLILDDARRNDNLKYNIKHFYVCKAIEDFRQRYNKLYKKRIRSGEIEECSINKAVSGADKIIRIHLGKKYTVEQADGIHRRIVKKNPRRWKQFLNEYYAHLET